MPLSAACLESFHHVSIQYILLWWIPHRMDSFIACINSIGGACGDEVMNRTQNSFSNISRGKLAFDIYMAWCLFHYFDMLPETSSINIIKGTEYTMRPFDFSRSGFGMRVAYFFDDSVRPSATIQNIWRKQTSKATVKLPVVGWYFCKGSREYRCRDYLLFVVDYKTSLTKSKSEVLVNKFAHQLEQSPYATRICPVSSTTQCVELPLTYRLVCISLRVCWWVWREEKPFWNEIISRYLLQELIDEVYFSFNSNCRWRGTTWIQ